MRSKLGTRNTDLNGLDTRKGAIHGQARPTEALRERLAQVCGLLTGQQLGPQACSQFGDLCTSARSLLAQQPEDHAPAQGLAARKLELQFDLDARRALRLTDTQLARLSIEAQLRKATALLVFDTQNTRIL